MSCQLGSATTNCVTADDFGKKEVQVSPDPFVRSRVSRARDLRLSRNTLRMHVDQILSITALAWGIEHRSPGEEP